MSFQYFFNVLTGPELLEITEAHLPTHRERLYLPTVALSMFINQVLDADGSCQVAVNRWAAQRTMEGLNPRSIATGGYCRARQRLPLMVGVTCLSTGAILAAQLGAHAGKLGNRPGRIEPRACKRRPKSSKWLKEPREQARQRMRDRGYVL